MILSAAARGAALPSSARTVLEPGWWARRYGGWLESLTRELRRSEVGDGDYGSSNGQSGACVCVCVPKGFLECHPLIGLHRACEEATEEFMCTKLCR